MTYLSPAPLYHSAPQAAVGADDPHRRHGDHHGALRSRAVPRSSSSSTASPTASSCRRCSAACSSCPTEVAHALRPVVAGDRRPRRRAVPGAGQGADDRVVGADHPSSTTAPPRASASPPATSHEWLAHQGTVGRCMLGDAAHPRRRDRSRARTATPGTIWFKTADAGSTTSTTRRRPQEATLARRDDEHGRRRRLRRRRRLPVPHRPQDVHDHLRRREHLSAGDARTCSITHPKVADAAVFGVPNDDLGEEVKAVVQPMPGVEAGPSSSAS